MKRVLLIASLSLLALAGYAQNDAAFAAYHLGDYATAVKRYKASIAKKATLYDRYMLALSYQKTDSIPQAKREFEKVANTAEWDYPGDDLRVQACEVLTRLYQNEKQYQQALHYHQLYKTIFERAKFDDVNMVRICFFNANGQAQCFAALGQTDSAIRVLTPYMFYHYQALQEMRFVPAYENEKDSLRHDTVSRFYLGLLRKRYSNTQIKAEFQKEGQSFKFTEDRPPVDAHGFTWERMKCAIHIYGINIVVAERGIGNKENKLLKEIKQPYYTKAYQLAQFRELPVCRMVRELK